jgi:preprotein translocase subunit SecG
LTIHLVVCAVLVVLILLQSGKEGMGVIFGGGSTSVFGSSGAGGILVKLTTIVALLFVITSLSYTAATSTKPSTKSTILDVKFEETAPPQAAQPTPPAPPVVPAPTAPTVTPPTTPEAAAPATPTVTLPATSASPASQIGQPAVTQPATPQPAATTTAPGGQTTPQQAAQITSTSAPEAAAAKEAGAQRPADGTAAPKTDDKTAPPQQ